MVNRQSVRIICPKRTINFILEQPPYAMAGFDLMT
jgi:hypothetical protein